MYKEKLAQTSWVLAPDLFHPEIANVLWKCYRAEIVSHEESIQFTEDGIAMVDDFTAGGELWKEALGEGIKYNHSIYDMFYTVLARRNDAVLITKDNKLAETATQMKIDVCI
ncbi:type II toxin-antitoxin system VapC family toxin [Marispirochaeta sp.]|uniref:type II toxin-antitoxin system VapC family toxin n=1 Tax=Marispirochaeta sp. TaxID=2038653 RepID=UPI002D1E36E4|nr:type II toxin-antitoxin system VapC family toxin [Marispirochaeta sp.]